MNQFRGSSRLYLSLPCTAAILFALALIVAVPGCSGCLTRDTEKDEEAEKENKEKKKPKPDFEVAQVRVQPTDQTTTQAYVKPSHWTSTLQGMKANNFDFSATVETAAVDENQRGIPIAHTPFELTISRPVSLPKGQARLFETKYYIAPRVDSAKKRVWMLSRLRAARGGREMVEGMRGTISMPSYQYFMVVLSAEPDRYAYLKQLYCVKPPSDELFDEEKILYYRVVAPATDRQITLPSSPLTWTSIAYIIWDGIDPNSLSRDQQVSLLDWLHFGGQIIVSGPDSLDRLQDSFLAKYLPAERDQTINLQASDFEVLNRHWSLRSQKKGELATLTILAENPPVGVRFKLRPDGQYVTDTGDLVAEKRVGRGRIAVTAFSLTSRQLRNWGCFDGFFNAALLRRPAREFRQRQGQQGEELSTAQAKWIHPRARGEKDVRLSTTLRYFTRDISAMQKTAPVADAPAKSQPQAPPASDDWRFRGYGYDDVSGICGWDDRSGAAEVARQSLREAAGISIPKRDFVLRVLGVYLVLLVPVNWLVFRLLGRVEWAWVAAPIIAILGAIAVIRLAQLDIGFARSRTEIGLLETHADYPRGHLTRYSALYTSLASTYKITFDDPETLALPFPNSAKGNSSSERVIDLAYRNGKAEFTGFQVDSNSIRYVHSEQMFDLGGAFTLVGGEEQMQIKNETRYPISGVAVIRKRAATVEIAWIGELESNRARALDFRDTPANQAVARQWEESPVTATTSTKGELNLRRMIDLATANLRLHEGEYRLIGWTGQKWPGMVVWPGSAQSQERTVVLAHLRRGALPKAVQDRNLISDVQDESRRSEDAQDADPQDAPSETPQNS